MTGHAIQDRDTVGTSAAIARSRPFTRAEKTADAAVHAAGVALALMGVPALIVLAVLLDGRATLVAAVSVYGVSLLAMFVCSGAYNLCPETRSVARAVLRRLDHAAIYVKIAGTQTPFAILVGGTHGFWLLAALWSGALGGVAARLFAPQRLQRLSILFYVALGWAGTSLLFPGLLFGDGAQSLTF
ncbi:MAG: hemolysin III, partial [Planctomycetota bacterium]